MSLPKITFGIVNCNRLYYLKCCLESLLECTSDYYNKEIIIVDNASVEEGTEDYLLEKEKNKIITVVRQETRDPKNEFAKALNKIVELSTGDLVCPIQGDMQFIARGGWLYEYAKIFKEHGNHIGSIGLDAQRQKRISDHAPFGIFSEDHMERNFRFYVDIKRNPIAGAGDVFYTRDIIEKICPWNTNNNNHEGGSDSETAMLAKVRNLFDSGELQPKLFLIPQIPVSVAIYTDSRGTNARVRGNKRYGDYWPGDDKSMYYEIYDFEDLVTAKDGNGGHPLPIELVAKSCTGKPLPIDSNGNWMKNPIRPEYATKDDYEILYDDGTEPETQDIQKDSSPDYIEGWLND